MDSDYLNFQNSSSKIRVKVLNTVFLLGRVFSSKQSTPFEVVFKAHLNRVYRKYGYFTIQDKASWGLQYICTLGWDEIGLFANFNLAVGAVASFGVENKIPLFFYFDSLTPVHCAVCTVPFKILFSKIRRRLPLTQNFFPPLLAITFAYVDGSAYIKF